MDISPNCFYPIIRLRNEARELSEQRVWDHRSCSTSQLNEDYPGFQFGTGFLSGLLLGYANEGVLGGRTLGRDFPLVLVVIVVVLDGLLGKK